METTIASWGEALATSLTRALSTIMATLPNLIAFLLIVLVGWFLASLLASGLRRLLRAMQFNRLARSSGFSDFVESMGVRIGASAFLAAVAKWFVRLIALVVAFDALGLPAVSNVLERLLLWLPNLAVAIVVLVIGGLAANAVSRFVRGLAREGGFENAHVMGVFAKTAVWAFAIIVAVNELGVATTLVNALFITVIGAIGLALGLSFGLGGREAASEVIAASRARLRDAEPKLRGAAAAAEARANDADEPDLTQMGNRRQVAALETSSASAHRRQERPGHDTAADVPRNHGKPWSAEDLSTLRSLAKRGVPAADIADRLERTEDAVTSKASDEDIDLSSNQKRVEA